MHARIVGRLAASLLFALCVPGCGGPEIVYEGESSEPEQPPSGSNDAPVEPRVSDRPVGVEQPPPEPVQTAPGPCVADAEHCCMPDGRLVRPGGCQPMYPPGVQPATERGADGRCESIPCTLRCLSELALIDTPDGARLVSELRVGDAVYTLDASGARVARPILRLEATPVGGAHALVELALADGRSVRASGGHPLASGGELAEVRVGDVVDGAAVVGVRTIPYDGSHTWDLLPAGASGAYWADGVLLGSTLGPEPD